ncbi:FecCD family ABC transporter permease [Candidatus Rhodobacter oscarellae]|nr:iron ABC transporter permease [Candidatus Rhodobacter lobularis]
MRAAVGLASPRRSKALALRSVLLVILGVAVVASLTIGATGISLWEVLWKLLTGQELSRLERTVLWDIRAPRTFMGMLVGASLAVSGAVMQGLFRNPLADPGLLGVSSGAGLGAIFVIVVSGAVLPPAVLEFFGYAMLPLAAFVGAWAVMIALYALATRAGRTSVATMLLGGIGIAALSGALSGIMVYMADDIQLRELTFWGMGALTGATWSKLLVAAPVMGLATLAALSLGQGLNGLSMGEATAHHIGIDVQRLKRRSILSVSAMTGAAVAVSGGIGFVGIIVPHLLRLAVGPDHRTLLLNAAIMGAALLLFADIVSRVIVAPSELPIGIVMAVIGGPVFLWILLRRRGVVDL